MAASPVSTPQAAAAPGQPITASELVDAVRRLFKTPGYSPPILPAVAIEVQRLSRHPDTSFSEIERQIASDAMLAARVIRLAQSPIYAAASPIRSLHDATSRVGLRTLGDLFLEVALSAKLFKANGYEKVMERMRLHSVAAAQATKLVAKLARVHEDYGYMVGLLHDVGIAAVYIALSEPKVAGPLFERAASMSFFALEQAVLGAHETAGALVASAWKMPPDLTMVIGRHHVREKDVPVHPVVASLWIGEAVAAACGFEGLDTPDESTVVHACDVLGLAPKAITPLHDQVTQQMVGRA